VVAAVLFLVADLRSIDACHRSAKHERCFLGEEMTAMVVMQTTLAVVESGGEVCRPSLEIVSDISTGLAAGICGVPSAPALPFLSASLRTGRL
jgi:hypothetical protein